MMFSLKTVLCHSCESFKVGRKIIVIKWSRITLDLRGFKKICNEKYPKESGVWESGAGSPL